MTKRLYTIKDFKVFEKICRDFYIRDVKLKDLYRKYPTLSAYTIDNALHQYAKRYFRANISEELIRQIVSSYTPNIGVRSFRKLVKQYGLPFKTIRAIYRFFGKRYSKEGKVTYLRRCELCNQVFKASLEENHTCAKASSKQNSRRAII